MPIYFITGNKNKYQEIKKIIPEVQLLDIDLPEIQETDPQKIIEAKIKEAFSFKKARFIVEDTSLFMNCLGGLPGPLIKWFLQSLGNQGLFDLADKFKDYRATAKTILGYAQNPQEIYYFEGSLKGTIVAPKGRNGFGWDPIFQPISHHKTLAEMNIKKKNSFSMRKMSAEKLKDFLKKTKK